MAYVRQQQIRKGEKTYRYYQLVRGYRENGKVKIEVLKHLGKYDSIEEARRATESVVTKEEVPEYVARLQELERESRRYHEAHGQKRTALLEAGENHSGLVREYLDLKGKRGLSQAERERRSELRRLLDELDAPLDKVRAVKDKAMELYDSLSEDEQEVVKGNLIPVVESGLSSREINKRLSTFL